MRKQHTGFNVRRGSINHGIALHPRAFYIDQVELHSALNVRREAVVVVIHVHPPAELEVFEVTPALSGSGGGFRAAQRGQEQAREQPNDGDDDEEFDEGEGGSLHRVILNWCAFKTMVSFRHRKETVSMTPSIPMTGSVPLEAGADEVIRIAGTRVTLDTVVAAFAEGATAEEIVQQYSSLSLADVYSVLAHYLRHRQELDAYLAERAARTEQVRTSSQLRLDTKELRSRLLARRGS